MSFVPPEDWLEGEGSNRKPTPAAVELSPPAGAEPEPKKVRVGFTVAVLEGTEELVMKVHGEKAGVMELRGLAEYAKKHIDVLISSQIPSEINELRRELDNLAKLINEKLS